MTVITVNTTAGRLNLEQRRTLMAQVGEVVRGEGAAISRSTTCTWNPGRAAGSCWPTSTIDGR